MKNKIIENWKAIEEIEQKVKAKTNDPDARFNASTFWFSSEGRHLMLPCMYRTKKGENFSKSYKDMMVYAEFCPFTGKPLYEDSGKRILNMKTYTLQQAQQLVADGAVIENDNSDIATLNKLFDYVIFGKHQYYLKNRGINYIDLSKHNIIKLSQIKLSQIQPEPIPNDVLKIVEKYGDKLLTYYESLKK